MRRHKFKKNEMASFWNRQGRYYQFTAINKASEKGCLEIVEYILSFQGIDLTICDKDGYNPFTYALLSGNTKLFNFFVTLFSSKYSQFCNFEKGFQMDGILEIIERKDLETLKVSYLLRGFWRVHHFRVVVRCTVEGGCLIHTFCVHFSRKCHFPLQIKNMAKTPTIWRPQ